MSHEVIIIHQGEGTGGSATTETRWKPSHTISPNEEARRRERAAKLQEKINDVLYGGHDGENDED